MWYKKDAGYWHNPTWLSMPWASAIVFDYLLADCKMFGGREGRVSLTHWQPETILHVMRLPVSCEDIREAMNALEACGKVVVSEGEVAVAEWKEYQTDPTNADRQKKHRDTAKKRTESNSVRTDSNGYITQRNATVTLRTVNNGEIERIDRSEREEGGSGGEMTLSLSEKHEASLPRNIQETLPLIPMTPRQVEAMEALRDVSFKVSGWSKPEDPIREILGEEAAASLARDLGGDAYPAVSVRQTIAQAAAWCRSNPSKAKTPRGLPRFLNRWFESEQNRGGTRAAPTPPPVHIPTRDEIESSRIQEMHDRKYGKQPVTAALTPEQEQQEASRIQALWDAKHGKTTTDA